MNVLKMWHDAAVAGFDGHPSLDQLQVEATAEIKQMVACTTLAMRAAKLGIESLTDEERRGLYRYVGFDMTNTEQAGLL